jgi:hypothetical protein
MEAVPSIKMLSLEKLHFRRNCKETEKESDASYTLTRTYIVMGQVQMGSKHALALQKGSVLETVSISSCAQGSMTNNNGFRIG